MCVILFSLPSTMCCKTSSREHCLWMGCSSTIKWLFGYWVLAYVIAIHHRGREVEPIQLSRLASSYAGDEDHEEVAVIRHEDKFFGVCKHCQLRVTTGSCTLWREQNRKCIIYFEHWNKILLPIQLFLTGASSLGCIEKSHIYRQIVQQFVRLQWLEILGKQRWLMNFEAFRMPK
jgi:hypothetical protein